MTGVQTIGNCKDPESPRKTINKMGSLENLPDYQSPSLQLVNPTPEERIAVWTMNSVAWKGALSLSDYLEREKYLTTVPLACKEGITHWILVDSSLPPNARPILGSCESLRKRALVAQNGTLTEVITHGIGSVFCNPEYRGRKYASRMLSELGRILRTWQTDSKTDCKFSILYSDIGLKFYAALGWKPFPSTHISFPPTEEPRTAGTAALLRTSDLVELCALDERYIRKQLAEAKDGKTHVVIIPEYDQMQWFHLREEFLCKHIFGPNKPGLDVKGAISQGPVGSRVWAVWTRSFYGPLVHESGNVLHILRLVVEDEKASTNTESLRGILEIAQAEAKQWQLNEVELWNPTPVVKEMVQKSGLEHSEVIRDKESIASLMWYGSGNADDVEWVGNEKFGWC